MFCDLYFNGIRLTFKFAVLYFGFTLLSTTDHFRDSIILWNFFEIIKPSSFTFIWLQKLCSKKNYLEFEINFSHLVDSLVCYNEKCLCEDVKDLTLKNYVVIFILNFSLYSFSCLDLIKGGWTFSSSF